MYLAHKLAADLFSGYGLRALFPGSTLGHAETIARIEASGEPAAALYLALYALDAKTALRAQAARVAGKLLAAGGPENLLWLDECARDTEYSDDFDHTYTAWNKVDRAKLASVLDLPEAAHLLGMFSLHPNGRVREEAVRLLAGMDSGEELPYLLIRLNDWVWPVNTMAKRAVQARLVPRHADRFAANITLVHRLTQWKRIDHSEILGEITSFLSQPECKPALASLLDAPQVAVRRLAFRLLASPEQAGLAETLAQAARDRDPTLRLWAMRQASAHLGGDVLLNLAQAALRDRYSRVRAQAIYVYAEQPAAQAVPVLRALLMDNAPAVRGMARFYLARLAPFDFRAFYRERLEAESGRNAAIALTSLGDVGTPADADKVAAFAQPPDGRLRKAALQALGRLDGDRFVAQFLAALDDPGPGVAGEAVHALSQRTALLDMEDLWERARTPRSPAANRKLFALLFNAQKWDSLYYALCTLHHSAPGIAAMAQNHVGQWLDNFNRSATQSTPAQRARLLTALDRAAGDLSPHLARVLRPLLQ